MKGYSALVARMQVEEFSTCIGHAAVLRDAKFKTFFLASEVVADQLAVPVAQELSDMFANATQTKVVNDRR